MFRVKSFEEALKKRFSPKSLDGLTVPADGLAGDIHGAPEYRAHLIGVCAARAAVDGVARRLTDRLGIVAVLSDALRHSAGSQVFALAWPAT